MVTIWDVAKDCNVSKSTVSLVINNSDAVKLETKLKVLESIKKLGYVPNMAARELQTKVKNILGMVFLVNEATQKSYSFDSVTETLFYDIFTGISSHLKDTDYGLLSERYAADGSENLPNLIKNKRVDGVFIIGGLFHDEFIQQLQEQKIPAVIVGRLVPGVDSVAPNVTNAIYLGTKHLLETGHRNIVFINGPEKAQASKGKLTGFNKALAEFERDVDSAVVFTDYTGNAGFRAMRELWDSGKHPDAVIAASDGIAVGAMRYLYEQKIRIPEDISIIGYEQSIISEHAIPALTTMDINKELMGQKASEMLMHRIQNPDGNIVHHTFETSIVLRDSVKNRG
ncbi:LacI family DNA-binding transcriptional regulator [Lederbergia graminis]|uniref:LacI family DNA-binding transcriptional regulator n=1 Tax=Lederbergia graminis TaxID=735518 RepID=A0ABW0LKB3_9BACI